MNSCICKRLAGEGKWWYRFTLHHRIQEAPLRSGYQDGEARDIVLPLTFLKNGSHSEGKEELSNEFCIKPLESSLFTLGAYIQRINKVKIKNVFHVNT